MCNKCLKKHHFLSDLCLITKKPKLNKMVLFKTFITHEHEFKINLTHFGFIGIKHIIPKIK